MENFIITGYGRSGTQFLATQLAKSKVWTVEHEPCQEYIYQDSYFDSYYHGIVSSYMLYSLLIYPARYKVLILRDPYAIVQSCYNRGHSLHIQHDVRIAVALLIMYSKLGVPYFKLQDFANSRAEVIKVARAVGIDDLEEGYVDLTPMNTSVTEAILDFKEVLHPLVEAEFEYFLDYFQVRREK